MLPTRKFALAIAALAGIALLGLSHPASAQSDTDLWDMSQGSVVTAHSPIRDTRPFGGTAYSDVENMFGGQFGTLESAMFQDGYPVGFHHYVQWHTLSQMRLDSFTLVAVGDGPNPYTPPDFREFGKFILYAKNPSTGAFVPIYTYTPPSHPYTPNGVWFVVNQTLASPIVAQDFRAVFTQYDPPGYTYHGGPRIIRLQGFGAPVGPPDVLKPHIQVRFLNSNWSAGTDSTGALVEWDLIQSVVVTNTGNAPAYNILITNGNYNTDGNLPPGWAVWPGANTYNVGEFIPSVSKLNPEPIDAFVTSEPLMPGASVPIDLKYQYFNVDVLGTYPLSSGQIYPLKITGSYNTVPANPTTGNWLGDPSYPFSQTIPNVPTP